MSNDSNIGQDLLDLARNNQLASMRKLLQKNQTLLNIVSDQDKQTALHWSVINNQGDMVDLLLTYNFEKNLFNQDYCTPAVLAAELNHWQCIEIFTRHEKSGNTRGLDTVLLHAVKEKQYKITKNLLRSGVTCNAIWTRTQFTPLHWAVENQDPAMISLLLDNGANQKLLDNSNSTALKRAWQNGSWPCVIALCKQANLEPADYNTALLFAARANKYHAVLALLAVGAEPNAMHSSEGYYALHWAVIHNNPELFALLIGSKANLAVYDKNHQTPIHLTFKLNLINIAYWFKALNVDENIKDNSDSAESAVAAGKRWHKGDCLKAIHCDKKSPSAMMVAIAQNDVVTMNKLFDEGVGISDKVTPEGLNSLDYAISIGQNHLSSIIANRFVGEALVEKSFLKACNNNQWQSAKAINKERAMALQLDLKFNCKLSWYGFHNTSIKADFIKQAELIAERSNCNKSQFFKYMAESKTATYHQLKFWSSATTKTTDLFNKQKVENEELSQMVM